MPINLETLQIQFEIRDNTGKKLQELEKKLSSVKSPEIDADTKKAEKKISDIKKKADETNGNMSVSADTKKAEKNIDIVKKKTESLPDGGISVEATTSSAIKGLEKVTKTVEEIPEAPKIKPEVETSAFSKGMATIRKLLIGSGLLAFGKGAYEFSMQALDESYGAQAVENQIVNLGGQTALDKIGAFTAEMNEKYELNESGLAEMAKNFSAVFKGAGMETEAALDKGIEMARYAIDYASALDKTPGEIADIFMSVLKGNTEVADSASIYGLTADVMDTKIAEMTGLASMQEKLENVTGTEAEALSSQIDTLNADIEKNKSLYKALAFFDIMKENADVKMGFTGDWERTFEEFGNQKTVLGEQFKTLKQNAGEILLPAANEIVKGLNDIISAVTDFTEKLGKSTFAKDVDGYFGTMTVDETTMNNAISHVTEPINKMTTALDNANASLKTATDSMSASYEAFLKVLLVSNTDGDLSNDMDKIEHAGEELANDAIFTVTAGRINLIERLNIFAGGLLEAETNAMVGIIDSYFDQAEEKVKQRKKEFDDAVSALKKENTPENLKQVKDSAFAMMQEAYTLSAGYIGSDEYDWLRSTYKSGQLSADTISEWMKGMNEASNAEQAKLRGEYEKARRDFVAIGQQTINEETGAFYTPGELNELFGAYAGEYTKAQEAEAKNRRLGFISEMLIGEYGNATLDVYDRLYKGKITGDEAAKQLSVMVGQLEESGLIGELINTKNKTPAMVELLDLWAGILPFAKDYESSLFQTLPPTQEMYEWGKKINGGWGGVYSFAREDSYGTGGYDSTMRAAGLATLYAAIVDAGIEDNPYYNPRAPEYPAGDWRGFEYMFPEIGKYLVDPEKVYDQFPWEKNPIFSAAENLNIPDKIVLESHIYVSGYELGKATEEATITYNTSTGSGNN